MGYVPNQCLNYEVIGGTRDRVVPKQIGSKAISFEPAAFLILYALECHTPEDYSRSAPTPKHGRMLPENGLSALFLRVTDQSTEISY
jgi:hypothetical protein